MTKPGGAGASTPLMDMAARFTMTMKRPFHGTLWAGYATFSVGKRACRLFEPISRRLARERRAPSPFENQEIAAMSALLDFNDHEETTHEMMMTRLRELPVWHGIGAIP